MDAATLLTAGLQTAWRQLQALVVLLRASLAVPVALVKLEDQEIMAGRFPRGVDRALRKAGWFPGRQVDTTRWRDAIDGTVMHPAAEAFLAEFGGLAVDVHGWGRTAAKEPFKLDPELCEGEEGRFQDWGEFLGRSLFPVGEPAHGRFFIGIDEEGTIYLVETWVGVFDGSADAGLTALCQGVMSRKLSLGY